MKLSENIKVIELQKKKLRDFVKEKYINEEGYAEFDINLTQDELISSISSNGHKNVSDAVIGEIEKLTDPIPYDYPIKFNIITDCDDYDIAKLIVEYYELQMLSKKADLRINKLKALWLLIIGIVFYGVYFLLVHFDVQFIYSEIVSIAATFAIWEAVDVFILERMAIRIEFANMVQLASAKIEIKIDEKKE